MNLKQKLVKYLAENAKYTVNQLASMTGADETAVAAAIKELEDDRVILKYAAVINESEESGVDALIEVKVTPQKLKGFDALAEELSAFTEVKSLYLMSGGFDLAVMIHGDGLSEIARFVSEKLSLIDGVTGVATHFILKKYKIEGQSTVPPRGEGRQRVL